MKNSYLCQNCLLKLKKTIPKIKKKSPYCYEL